MRKGGGKAKGSEFERTVCKKLSLWVSKGTAEDVFWRSAMSGGRATVAGRKGNTLAAQAGDISCVSPLGHDFISRFYVECKSYKDLRFSGLITQTGPFILFWNTAKMEAAKYDKTPLLIAKQNQMPIIAVTTFWGVERLRLKAYTILESGPLNLCVVLFDDYLKNAEIVQ